MSKLSFLLLIFSSLVIPEIDGKQFEKCELAKILKAAGFKDLQKWMCILFKESSFRTHAAHFNEGGPNPGSTDYGLFQFNSGTTCLQGQAGGDCNIDCNSKFDFKNKFLNLSNTVTEYNFQNWSMTT